MSWYNKNSDAILKELKTNASKGLSSEEAKNRLEKYGENKLLSASKKNIFQLLFEQVNDILIYILLGAAIISAAVGEISDAIIIAIVIIINAVVGVLQEFKAEKSLEALKQLSTPKAVVKRDGELKEIASEEVVPGDIIIIDAGRYIPCDLRLIETANLQIEESALTGESVPVDKFSNIIQDEDNIALGDQKNMAFMSTLSTYGRGIGVAIGTGMNTEIGKIAKMLNNKENELTPLQKKLEQLGKILGIAAICICVLIFFVGFLQKRDLFEMFLTSISLAVAAIPEGLPAIVTIVLAMGVQKMIKKNAIVKKLPAVETLGSVNIICSDKTGTLTQNKMTVTKFYTDGKLKDISEIDKNNKSQDLLVKNIVLCNDATYSVSSQTGDPTEVALLEVGANIDLPKEYLDKTYKRVNEIPFESDRKLMSTINKFDNEYYVMTKGAIDNLLKLCTGYYKDGEILPIDDKVKKDIARIALSMSDEALRVLGSAFKIIPSEDISIEDIEKDLVFIGLVGMIDPPRLEVKDSISLAKQSGIRTVMITGDHKNTAFAIAKDLGIADDESQAISGSDLDKMTEATLNNKIDDLRVFARVSPEHKVKIVNALKAKGNIVSMTGDGVNDAPSLKIADIGVAMGITGTDVAKGASDMILTDDNFSTIVSAIKEGRIIFSNIKKSILFLISCNLGEIFCLFLAILLGWAAPLRPIHILWVNLITDTLPALALGIDTGDPDIMKEKPRDSKESIFSGNVKSVILNGLLIGFLTLVAFIVGVKIFTNSNSLFPLFPKNVSFDALEHAQTMAFIVLSVSQLVHAFNMRSEKKSIFTIGIFSNKLLVYSFIIGVFLQCIIITIPALSKIFTVHALTGKDWLFVAILSFIPLLLNELAKIFKK